MEKMCNALGSENRVTLLECLMQREKPIDIARKLDISRAGLQKHLDRLVEVGLIQRKGSGRRTRFVPTSVTRDILTKIRDIAMVLETQKQLIDIDDVYEKVLISTDGTVKNKDEFLQSLIVVKEEKQEIIHKFITSDASPPTER